MESNGKHFFSWKEWKEWKENTIERTETTLIWPTFHKPRPSNSFGNREDLIASNPRLAYDFARLRSNSPSPRKTLNLPGKHRPFGVSNASHAAVSSFVHDVPGAFHLGALASPYCRL